MSSLKKLFEKSASAEAAKRNAKVNGKLEKLADNLEKKIARHIRWHPGNPRLNFLIRGLEKIDSTDYETFAGFRRLREIGKKNDMRLDIKTRPNAYRNSSYMSAGPRFFSEVVVTLNEPYANSSFLHYKPAKLPGTPPLKNPQPHK